MSFAFLPNSDRFTSRAGARHVASLLRRRGYQATVERSANEYRVLVRHPHYENTVAYVQRENLSHLPAVPTGTFHWIKEKV